MPTATAEARPAIRRSVAGWRSTAWRPVPAASFVAFRIAFGVVVAVGAARFVVRGWVGEFYLEPARHLTYAGFEWVRPLPAPLMYAHVLGLAALGVVIACGRGHRLAAAMFAIGFAYTELIDAALYLNHYWFVTLAAILIAVVPAPRDGMVPAATIWALRGQLAVVYVFAGLAKLNADWLLRAEPMHTWLSARTDRPLVGWLLDEPAVAVVFSLGGAMFDLSIVGWLLWRRSRPLAYGAVIVFHVATAALFQIGLFPWMMIALTPIFFEPDWPRRTLSRLTRRADHRPPERVAAPRRTSAHGWSLAVTVAVLVMALGNVAMPIRHVLADGNVRFNDDGYYGSWRVMLTERTAFVEFEVRDPATGRSWRVAPDDLLAEWQAAQVVRRPDLILATAHLIADRWAESGYDDVEVRVDAWVSFNGRPRQRWIDPTLDLARVRRSASGAEYVLPDSPAEVT